ncbi:MAG: hydrogenase maturation protease [Candidatus Marinimicrobia bacterium]|nr:hydrogenase maturation protease [Candidatus Neomarinimicrobiota bacterium]
MAILTVIGVGNRLRGDDAVGPLLIDELSKLSDPRLELVDAGSDALGILEYLEDRNLVLVVDACRMGKAPGSLLTFRPFESRLIMDADPLSLHGLGLAETLDMAESLHMLPTDLKIIGIEPDSIQFNGKLSSSVQEAMSLAIEKIHDELLQLTN